jgi:hypothetical protein
MGSGAGVAGTAVPARPVHPAARMNEQTRIAKIRYRELLILYDPTEWYKNMSIHHCSADFLICTENRIISVPFLNP